MDLQEMRKKIANQILSGDLDFEVDNTGQVLFYTGLYASQSTNKFSDTPDPNWDDDYPV